MAGHGGSPQDHDDVDDDLLNEDCFLCVVNLPAHWEISDYQAFIKKTVPEIDTKTQLLFVHKMNIAKNPLKSEIIFQFLTESACLITMRKLQGMQVEGKRLLVIPKAVKLLSAKARNKARTRIIGDNRDKTKKLKAGDWSEHEKYGLSEQFLNALGITPPLGNKIHISNLSSEVTETKLREIFSYAGHVVAASLSKSDGMKVHGKILYDHPVEAVQAVSMFNQRELYSRTMIVKIDKWQDTTILPDKLNSIGPGLGANGMPLTSVRHKLEIEPLKQLLLQEIIKLSELTQKNIATETSIQPNNPAMSALTVNTTPSHNHAGNLFQILQHQLGGTMVNALQQPWNQVAQPAQSRFDIPPSGLGQNAYANVQNMYGSMGQMASFQQNALMTTKVSRFDVPPTVQSCTPVSNTGSWTASQWSHVEPQYTPSRSPDNSSYGNKKFKPDDFDVERLSDLEKSDRQNAMTSSDMLVFTNLPSSVTSKALVNKMSEVGELKFAEITSQGRAIVRFQDVKDAQRCAKLYDRSRVDGQVINVNFF